MSDAPPSPSPRASTDSPPAEDPADSVWQEYPVSFIGDFFHAVTVLLASLATGCALACMVGLLIQIGFAAVLGQWIPHDDVEAWGISALLVSVLLAVMALAVRVVPGLLAKRSMQKSLLRAIRQSAPRTQVPHPVQQTIFVLGRGLGYGMVWSAFFVLVAGLYLLVRIIMDPHRSDYWQLEGLVVGYALVALGLAFVLGLERTWLLKRFPDPRGKKAKKKNQKVTAFKVARAYSPKKYSAAVAAKAAQAAGYDSLREARRIARKAKEQEDRKAAAGLRPPQVGGGAPPIPTHPEASGPEWVYWDQPRAMWWANRVRWYSMLIGWLAMLLTSALAETLFGDDPSAHQYLDSDTVTAAIAVGVTLILWTASLVAVVALAVIRTWERVHLLAAAADPDSDRPAEGVLARHSAAQR